MRHRRLLPLLALVCAWASSAALAQTPKPLSAEDAVLAYDAAQLSRSAVRDQLALCVEDAEKLDQVYTRLRPAAAADRAEWNDWGDLYARIGGELKNCLRSYVKQLALHRRDLALLRERLPLLKEPKRLTISPKLVAQINAYNAGLKNELTGYYDRARGLANAAELASGRTAALLREAGVPRSDVPQGFDEGL
ncbi:MAG: hypothetical protein AB7R90_12255 [Reyranellaceae bacterium]